MSCLKKICRLLFVITLVDPKGYSLVSHRVALVYHGTFASGSHDFHSMLTSAGYKVRTFKNVNELQSKLSTSDLLLFPGTDDEAGPLDSFVAQFQTATVQAIRDFVNQGGIYVGVCGGAYIASTTYTTAFDSGNGLGLVPIATEGYLTSDAPTILYVYWKNKRRSIYYQLGPRFLTSPSSSTDVIATYADGTIAACIISQGSGKLYLVGPHPEVLSKNLEPSDIPDGTLDQLTDTSDLLKDMMADLAK